MSNLVHNKRTKYAATFLNNIGVASFFAGGVVPAFAVKTLNLIRVSV